MWKASKLIYLVFKFTFINLYLYIILTVNAVEIDIKYKTYSNNNNNNIMQAYNSQNYRNEFLKLARYAYLLRYKNIEKKKLNLLDSEQRMYFFIWCLLVHIINLCNKEK